jgi:hypothetical protein
MAARVRTKKERRPTITCSPDAEIIYGEWVSPAVFQQDALDGSPLLSTVDSTFWSESEIERLGSKTTPASMNQADHTAKSDSLADNITSMLSILPLILGCPLPTECFHW